MRRIEAAAAVVMSLVASLALATALAALPDAAAKLPPSLQRQLQSRQAALQAMTASQRQALQQRVADWDALSLAERRRRREYWQAWQALPSGQRWQLRTAARQFAGLPADQQQALRARFAELDDSDRRGWLLGPGLGAFYPGLRPLLMQVPAAERDPLLAVLRAMTTPERLDLVTLAQRTPPQDRAALRRELLSTSAANRLGWLRARLER